jgi:hypothetical protein
VADGLEHLVIKPRHHQRRYRLGVVGMSGVERGKQCRDGLARRFVHSLVPIALAYVIAHYFSLLIYQSQATAYLPVTRLDDVEDIHDSRNVLRAADANPATSMTSMTLYL